MNAMIAFLLFCGARKVLNFRKKALLYLFGNIDEYRKVVYGGEFRLLKKPENSVFRR